MMAGGRTGFIQGHVGVAEVANLDAQLGGGDFLRDADGATLPTFGGTMGEFFVNRDGHLRLGVEGGFNLAWDNDRQLRLGGSGFSSTAEEVDLVFMDAFVGLSLDLALGRRFRLYAGSGPLLQYGELSFEGADDIQQSFESGFGTGIYARTGFEFELQPGSWIGLGLRWFDSRLDLGAGADLDLEATELLFTASNRW